MEEEIWKDIPGYEGKYQVSNLGNIKSLYNKNGKGISYRDKILKKYLDNTGYLKINLSINNFRKTFNIHKIVAQTFLKNPLNKPEVNHIDGNKQNNNVSNLGWCTRSENEKHKFRHLGYKNNFHINNPSKKELGKIHFNSKKINQYDLNGNFIKTWDSITDVKSIGINPGNIYHVCVGNTKTAGGFIFKYYDDVKA